MSITRLPIEVDTDGASVTVPHWGITLRRLFGAALDAWPDAPPGATRDVDVIYKGAHVATLHVRQLREDTDAPRVNAVN